ncbi:hypothetical protein [Nocardioides jensenii]|uniref:hypothetical protein n=1 Tax=Nocardioides jensenii TaxID=1843 RepID=UPI0008353531|nr:hypothetical protein [Nocardioides jensenii]
MASVRVMHHAVWALLDALTGVNTYDGEIVDGNGNSTSPPADPGNHRVYAYAVLYYSPGRRHANALNGLQASTDGAFQVTCAAGDPTSAMWCVDQVLEALAGAAVEIDGVVRRIRIREDDVVSLRRDDNVTPARFYAPLHFRLLAP